MKKPLILIFSILIIDQVLKIWVKINLCIGEEISLIGDWCKIHFIENEGMAFGMSFGGEWGKLFLTLFRIIASVLIFIYLKKLVERKESKVIIYSMALIFAGAVGNIIDSLFYGLIFSESSLFNTATIFQGGYGTFLHGKVVDMFYLPIIDSTYPSWFPFIGGEPFRFFNAIFNVADISITIGVLILIISVIISPKKKGNDKKEEVSEEEILPSSKNTELDNSIQ